MLALEGDQNLDSTCKQVCVNQYSACLNGVGGSVVGGTACCLSQLDACLCACPPPNSDSGNQNPACPGCPQDDKKSPNTPTAGDPVDLATGLFLYQHDDLTLKDVIPIGISRSYRELDPYSRAFGIGVTLGYDYVIVPDASGNYAYANLILPDGRKVYYARTSSGTYSYGAQYQNTTLPGEFFGSTLTMNGAWVLSLRDGTKMYFGSRAMLTSIVDRNGNTVSIQRDSLSRAATIISPNGRWIGLSYDSSNRVTEAQDYVGRTVYYTYDSTGHLSQVTDANGGVTSYAYDSAGRMFSFTTPDGYVHAQNQYDANNRVTQQTQPDGGVLSFAYTLDSNGNVTATSFTDATGSTRYSEFSTSGFVTSDTRASGTSEQETITYNRDPSSNLVLSTTDSLNRTTSYTYDSLGDVTSLTRMTGTSEAAATSYTYDPNFNQVTSVTDPLGHTWTIGLDANGNPASIADPLGNQTALTYNSEGEPLTITNPVGNKVSLLYRNGDLASVTDPLGNATSFFEDFAGRLIMVSDPYGNATSFAYDPLDDLTQIGNAMGGVTVFTYDADRNLMSVTDANGNKTTYTYDAMDQRASRKDALGAAATYAYDGNGNLTRFTDRRGTVTLYQYDGLNRLVFAGYGSNGSGQYQGTIAYTYDAGDRLTQAVDSLAGTIVRAYDGLDDLTEEQTPQGAVTYTYDLAGRRLSMAAASQATVNYAWDNADRLTGITQGTTSVGFSYDTSDRRTKLSLPNGMILAYTYDADSRITAMNWTLNGNPVGDLEYAYDADGRVIQKTGSLASSQLPSPVSGNTFNADNEMTAFNGATLTYDADGNLTNDGTNTYTWDARGHLSTLAGTNVAAYQYDAFGRRTQNTLNGLMTQYLYDGLNPVEEFDGTSPPNPTATMLTGLGIDEYFQRIDSSGTLSYLSDTVGSTLALADSSGALDTNYTYEPFGATTVNGSSGNPYQFTGRENDGTGLYYYRARYYSPAFQRFISQDPIGFAGRNANVYGYASNDPIDYRDASGNLFIAGLLTTVACSAYDLYDIHSMLSEESALEGQLNAVRQQIQDLKNQDNSCPNVNPQREQQIEELEQKAFNLAEQFAAAHASDVVKGLTTTTLCVGLSAVAWSPLVPF